jgi:hypothetical protein
METSPASRARKASKATASNVRASTMTHPFAAEKRIFAFLDQSATLSMESSLVARVLKVCFLTKIIINRAK